MKFSQNLPRNQVPEWSSEYINYKGLKKLIKSAGKQLEEDDGADLAAQLAPKLALRESFWLPFESLTLKVAEFFYSLDRNLENVDGFYNKRLAEFSRRLRLLNDRYGQDIQLHRVTEKEEIEDIIGALLELRSQMRKLQWYGEVNRRGFVKITKKLDKKVPSAAAQQQYLHAKVDPKPFASNRLLSQDLNNVNVWLSRLGDIKPTDDTSSTHSSIAASRAIIRLPKEMFDDIDRAIKRDDAAALQSSLSEASEYEKDSSGPFQRLLLNLLQRAIAAHAKTCIILLLQRCPSLVEEDDMNDRTCIHRLIISIGRSSTSKSQEVADAAQLAAMKKATASITPAEAPSLQTATFAPAEVDKNDMLDPSDPAVQLLTFLLDNLSVKQREVLLVRDGLGRLPLHYAARYGFVLLCDILIQRMKAWSQFDMSKPIDSAYWQDTDGNTPLHTAVIGGHPLTTQALLDACRTGADAQGHEKLLYGPNNLLSMATQANFCTIVRLLVEYGADVNFTDESGETALHYAARLNNVECATAIFNNSWQTSVNVDVPEKTFGWTPLTTASADGQLEMVKLLVEHGAQVDSKDSSGWTAQEHAALRGHMPIAHYLKDHMPSISSSLRTQNALDDSKSPLNDRRSNGNGKDNGTVKSSQPPIKSFGHRYLKDDTMILVSLGSMDFRKGIKPVTLDNIPLEEAHATQLDTALSLVISASGATGESEIIDLPVQENISTDPISFTTKDPSKVRLLFDIVPTYSGSKDQVVGRGVALLSSVKSSVGSMRMNLQGDITVPVVAAKTLEYIGSVHFNFIVITPFNHPSMGITEKRTYWKSLTEPMVIGHRGLGKNTGSRQSLQLGENTIQSFIAAANLGASYVEFDVQLTKDHVPVIYHDFLVSETGIDAPVHSLTLEQFLHVQDGSTPRSSRQPSPSSRQERNGVDPATRMSRRERANSLGSDRQMVSNEMSEKMKHTRDFKLKGFKGNSRGNSIQAPFTTLEEMFRSLPENIGFNIEMKYPMLFETEEQEMDTYAVELNSFVDTVLKKVYDLGSARDVIFSSFNPDICLLLSFKQPSIPILFLTDAGCSTVGDIRASSLKEAIRFASRWNLLGIVSAAEPLVVCPRLVRVVKESGLVCVSYGTLNNDPANVKSQVKEGIDAVIVDSVLAIRKGLTHAEEPTETTTVVTDLKRAQMDNEIPSVQVASAAT